MGTGRPSVYNPDEYPKIAREQTACGKTLADLAQLFDVARSTIQDWQAAHPAFAVAIKLGREDATDKVEASLFERATGYRHASEKIVVVSGGEGMGSSVERVPIEVQYPPDTAAARLWLTNLRAGNWKDRQSVEHSGTLTLEQMVGESLKRDTPPASPPSADHG
jgi:hypothetical protein